MSDYILRDLQRRLSNLVRRGRVHSVDFSQMPPRCKVEYAKGAVTAWLPFVSFAAGANCSTWEPISVGEQVIILAESGDLNLGIVIPSLHCSDNPPPATDSDTHMIKYGDATALSYNRATKQLHIQMCEGGKVVIDADQLVVNGDIVHQGNQQTSGNIKASGDVSDSTRSMAADRDIFNGHDHTVGSTVSSKPNQTQK